MHIKGGEAAVQSCGAEAEAEAEVKAARLRCESSGGGAEVREAESGPTAHWRGRRRGRARVGQRRGNQALPRAERPRVSVLSPPPRPNPVEATYMCKVYTDRGHRDARAEFLRAVSARNMTERK